MDETKNEHEMEHEKNGIKSEKRRLRQVMKARLNALPDEYCQKADRELRERLYGLGAWMDAEVVFCYVGTGREIDTVPLLERALAEGKRVGVPLCTGPGIMEVRQIAGIDDLVPGFSGILEPKGDCALIRPEEILLAVIPGLSFTADGGRLGYGGGYYDRYLPGVRGLKLALCREACLSSYLPAESHDIKLDGVLTENSTLFLIHSVKV